MRGLRELGASLYLPMRSKYSGDGTLKKEVLLSCSIVLLGRYRRVYLETLGMLGFREQVLNGFTWDTAFSKSPSQALPPSQMCSSNTTEHFGVLISFHFWPKKA